MGWEALTKHQDDQEGLIPEAQKYVEEWVADVSRLIVTVEGYLQPLRDDGRVKCHRKFLDVSEEGLGNYTIEQLDLEFRQIAGKVELVPKSALVRGVRLPNGAWKTGVSGRVNLSYGATTVPFTRIGREWSIGVEGEFTPLDEPRFQGAITKLLGVG